MSGQKRRLVFISPVFLFPNDAGGKIRTTNILRGLKSGAFEIILLSVATAEQQKRWATEIEGVCDHFLSWAPNPVRPKWLRSADLFSNLPVNVTADQSVQGSTAVRNVIAQFHPDVVVFDFVHSAVLLPKTLLCAGVCFTHNVESEIFARHAAKAPNWMRRWLWSSQHRKMLRFEQGALNRFSAVVAVSDRDARFFTSSYHVKNVQSIPTGVDLDFFKWQEPLEIKPGTSPTIVFTGSMDWEANIDGVQFFLREVWPQVLSGCPKARFIVVGRNPPPSLLALGKSLRQVEFTGFVDDVRPYVYSAHVFVIPLLVGGGTRIKAFEAMAMGCPIVSTSIGTEGLGAEPGLHFLERDDVRSLAGAILGIVASRELRLTISRNARHLVEQRFGHQVAASAFEKICLNVLAQKPSVE